MRYVDLVHVKIMARYAVLLYAFLSYGSYNVVYRQSSTYRRSVVNLTTMLAMCLIYYLD